MPLPESPDKPNISLTEKIAELEALLDREKTVGDKQQEQSNDKPAIADGSVKIPVLNELVTAEDYPAYDAPTNEEPVTATSSNYAELANKLEHKFSEELDQVVNILKGNLKNSIMEELQTQLHNEKQTGPHHSLTENNQQKDDAIDIEETKQE